MTYAILGSGAIGHAIATQFARKGIDVLLANKRGPESIADVVAKLGPSVRAATVAEALRADIVFMAVPFTAVADAVSGASPFAGRIVVDATNAIDFPGFTPTDLGGRMSSDVLAEWVPGARVVKACNTLPAAVLEADPAVDGGRRVLFVAGNDAAACQDVGALLERLGFFPIQLGTVAEGGRLQQFGGPLTVHSLIEQGIAQG